MTGTSIRLVYNKGYKWFATNSTHVKGYIITPDSQLLKDADLARYFSSAETVDDFNQKLQQANGLFSVIVKRSNGAIWAAVDTTRAFPLFYYHKDDFFAVTDNPDELAADGIPLAIDENNAVILSYAGFVTDCKTLLKNIFQIRAGEFITFEKNTLQKEFHTQFLTDSFFSLSQKELKEELKKVLHKMGEHLVKALDNRPAVIPLSGGFDSRILAYLLKKNGYSNVFCYTYGAAGNAELNNARRTAKNLGYKWYFIEYNEFYSRKMNEEPLFKEYTHFSACYASQSAEQDYFAMQKLLSLNKIPDNAVFIPGHSGAIAGDLLTVEMENPSFNYVDYVLGTTFSQVFPRKKEIKIVRKEVDFFNNSLNRQYPPSLIYENWRFQETTSKFGHNGAKIWDFFGYEYLLPLWDSMLFNFFVKVPAAHKYGKNLYKETLAELFDEYSISFPNEELYYSEKLIRKIAFRSKLKKHFPMLKMFVNIWNVNIDRTGAKYYLQSFVRELKKAGCYRKMLNINGILSAWYLLEVKRNFKQF